MKSSLGKEIVLTNKGNTITMMLGQKMKVIGLLLLVTAYS
jgi:hypothetical protein